MRIVRYLPLAPLLLFLMAASWSDPAADLVTARLYHTATMLRSGDVLVVGGMDSAGDALSSAELYHPDTDEWTSAGNLSSARMFHTATLLPSGKVLVVGGWSEQVMGSLTAAELYDPASNSWSSAGSLTTARDTATATLLPSGKVLVAGGEGSDHTALASAELYDPATNSWSDAASMTTPRIGHTATLLPSGKVLVVGGQDQNGDLVADTEIYDPAKDTWSSAGTLVTARYFHTATLLPSGQVFVAGGYDLNGFTLASTELYDPANGWTSSFTLVRARAEQTATLAPNGDVVLLGGFGANGVDPGGEVVDVAARTSTSDPVLDLQVAEQTATLLPSGRVLVVGGEDDSSSAVLATVSTVFVGVGQMVPTGVMNEARAAHTATLLPNGQVLVTGGVLIDPSSLTPVLADGGVRGSAERFDPGSGAWSETGALTTPRFDHTATLLTDGGVLVVGGFTDGGVVTGTAEQFDLTSGSWTSVAPLGTARALHSATRLHSGQVLVVGGVDAQGELLASAELYDPRTGQWAATAPLAQARAAQSATLLPSGQVLVVGGIDSQGSLATAEKYNPTTRTWSSAGVMSAPLAEPAATLLANGKVLVSVGSNATAPEDLEIYDPASNLWTDTGIPPIGPPRLSLLPTGDVLFGSSIGLQADALFNLGLNAIDPLESFGQGGPAGSVGRAPMRQGQSSLRVPGLRQLQTSTRLVSGKVLVAGGLDFGTGDATSASEVYDEGADDAWRPTLVSPGAVLAGQSVTLNGTLFEGVSPGSSGATITSPGGIPSFSLYSLLTEQTRSVPVSRYTATSADVTLPTAPPGRYILSVCVNAICDGTWLDIQSTGQPFADDQTLDVQPATALPVSLSATDPNGLPLSYSVVASPLHGTLTGTAPSLTYTPTAGYSGADHFTFQASNGKSASNVGTISLNVLLGAPPPVAVSRKLTTFQDTAIPATLVVNGAPGAALTYSVVASPKHGKLSGTAPKLTYTPDNGYTGTDGFTFQASDGTRTSNVATVSITVSAAKNPAAPPSPYVASGCSSSGTSGGLAGLGLLALLVGFAMRRRGAELRVGALVAGLLVCGLWGSRAVAAAWTVDAQMGTPRDAQTATLLPDGRVLVVGGEDVTTLNPLSSAEIYDPVTDTWMPTAPMMFSRIGASAVLLPNGTVLVVGGASDSSCTPEIFDPAQEAWSQPQPQVHVLGGTLTLFQDGRVLLLGSMAGPAGTSQAAIYDPASGQWTPLTQQPPSGLRLQTASLLSSGEVLVTGEDSVTSIPTAHIFNPSSGSWSPVSAPNAICTSATLLRTGKVLCVPSKSSSPYPLPQLYDPMLDSWSPTGPNLYGHFDSTATLLPGGGVLAVGNLYGNASGEIYDPSTNTWSDALLDGGPIAGSIMTATLLSDGKLLLAGLASAGGSNTSFVQEYDPGYGKWLPTHDMPYAASDMDAVELPSGRALIFGPAVKATRFDPATGTWMSTGYLPHLVSDPAAAVLQDGRVLVTGGDSNTSYAEIYAEGTNTWTPTTGQMTQPREDHTAVTLEDGRVLILGGNKGQDAPSTRSTEIFDPSTGTFSPAANMSQPRSHAAAVVLPSSAGVLSGDVLVCGGVDQECSAPGTCTHTQLASCAIYDPPSATWTPAASMGVARWFPFMFVLPNGKVLVGSAGDTPTALYDPTTDQWSPTQTPMPEPHAAATQLPLPDGRVLAAGGVVSTEADLYDWKTDTWTAVGDIDTNSLASGPTLVPVNSAMGWVLLAGGYVATRGNSISSAELWAPPVDTSDWAPVINPPGTVPPYSTVTLTGSNFRGGTEASGGTGQSSPTDYPIMTLQSIDGGTVYPLPFSKFSDTTASFELPVDAGEGAYTLTMAVNGISSSVPLNVDTFPVASDQTVNAIENTNTSITLEATDADGDSLTYSIVNGPSSGALSAVNNDIVKYTPNVGFHGSDSFTFKAYDGHEYSNVATVTLQVDAPPIAKGQSVTVNENGSVSITLAVTDADDAPSALTYTVGAPSHGVVNGTPPNLTYTPNAGYSGPDSFTFEANDGTTGSNVATVSLTVTAPSAQDQSVTVDENGSVPVTLVGTDSDGDTLTYVIATPPSFGTLSGTAPNLTYTPNADYFGADFFTFKVNDGLADSNTALVDIVVGHVDQLPTASAQSVTTPEDGSVAITLSGTDPDGDTFTYQIATPPAHGALSGTAPNLTYTPNPDFNGSDGFTFVINDGAVDSKPAKVSITVTPVNDAPVALAQSLAGTESTPIPILLSATNLDGDALTYAVVTQPSHGTLSGTAPSLTYTSAEGYTGADSFTFQVSDGQATSAPAKVDISVETATTSAPTTPTLLFPSTTDQLPAGKVTFGWKPSAEADGGAVHYRVEVSRDGKVVFSTETDQTSVTSDALEAGQYTWHVVALNDQDEASAPSENRSLELLPLKASGGVGCSTVPGRGSPWSGLLVVLGALGLAGARKRGGEAS